jgi:hypothetical protein
MRSHKKQYNYGEIPHKQTWTKRNTCSSWPIFCPNSKSSIIAYSLGNRLYDYDYKWQVEEGVQAPLIVVDEDTCKIPTLWRLKRNNMIEIRKACGFKRIKSECIIKLPWRSLVYLTHLFNDCLQLSHFPVRWNEAKVITLPNPAKD